MHEFDASASDDCTICGHPNDDCASCGHPNDDCASRGHPKRHSKRYHRQASLLDGVTLYPRMKMTCDI
jgi:hypothetical protein